MRLRRASAVRRNSSGRHAQQPVRPDVELTEAYNQSRGEERHHPNVEPAHVQDHTTEEEDRHDPDKALTVMAPQPQLSFEPNGEHPTTSSTSSMVAAACVAVAPDELSSDNSGDSLNPSSMSAIARGETLAGSQPTSDISVVVDGHDGHDAIGIEPREALLAPPGMGPITHSVDTSVVASAGNVSGGDPGGGDGDGVDTRVCVAAPTPALINEVGAVDTTVIATDVPSHPDACSSFAEPTAELSTGSPTSDPAAVEAVEPATERMVEPTTAEQTDESSVTAQGWCKK